MYQLTLASQKRKELQNKAGEIYYFTFFYHYNVIQTILYSLSGAGEKATHVVLPVQYDGSH